MMGRARAFSLDGLMVGASLFYQTSRQPSAATLGVPIGRHEVGDRSGTMRIVIDEFHAALKALPTPS